MIMTIEKVTKITKRLNLRAPYVYCRTLLLRPDLIEKYTNGVGSEVSWTYHLTPDTIWGLNINPASHIHDFMYTFPFEFSSKAFALAYKRKADNFFEWNVTKLIDDGAWYLRWVRKRRLAKYMLALRNFGEEAFYESKIIAGKINEDSNKNLGTMKRDYAIMIDLSYLPK